MSETTAREDDQRHTAAARALTRLLQVMATLRGPQGCPWDRAQTHATLLPYLVEEAYELIEAAEGDDAGALREELGDVLLQVVFHAQVAAERGAFDFAQIAAGLADKLEQRHPHVFGDGTGAAPQPLASAEAVRDAWHRSKMQGRDSALDGVPTALPALQRALQTGSRAARAGFEWHDRGEIFAKIEEELAEYRREVTALERASPPEAGVEQDAPPDGAPDEPPDADAAELEFGDLLFALVQLARWQRIDPERALRRSTRKFAARFRHMEAALRARGESPQACSAATWWALWAEAKAQGD